MEAWCDWECPRCSLINEPDHAVCEACDFHKPGNTSTEPSSKRVKFSIDDLIDLVSEEDDDADLKAAIAASTLEHMNASVAFATHASLSDTNVVNDEAKADNNLLKELHRARMERQNQHNHGTVHEQDALDMVSTSSEPSSLTVASLNVWFDEVAVEARIVAITDIFSKMLPDVIFLQEVTPDMGASFKTKLARLGYTAANDVTQAYGEMILVKSLPILHYTRHPFTNSAMGRGLHVVETQFQHKRLRLATAHLESLAQNRGRRVAQLKWAFDFLLDDDGPWIFGGDMNLSSKDVVTVPSNVDDAWIVTGRAPAHQHTWDTTINKNLPNVSFAAKCRFDRLYSHAIHCNSFETFGKTRLVSDPTLFPSDQWGIVAVYATSHAVVKTQEDDN
ncbi:unnamed protein product [Aphanomyces euteiches]